MDEARAVALQSALTFHAAVDDLGLRVGVDADQTIAGDEVGTGRCRRREPG